MPSVYLFADGCEDKIKLGNKGANLVIMSRLGLPVPPGFVISTEAYHDFQRTHRLPKAEIDRALAHLEAETGRTLGKGLMVSARSTAAVSMPGMMDSVLNIDDRARLESEVEGVFSSWYNRRAVEYRRQHNIPNDLGTATVIQAMVMGNRDAHSGTGVVFTRNPNTGERKLFGEYLTQAQGESLVSGVRTPNTIDTLLSEMPQIYNELEEIGHTLEKHFHDMQDIEFTIESGKLYILQTRSGKRSGRAAIRIAVDMVKEGLITPGEAILRVTPDDLEMVIHKHVDSPEKFTPLTQGLNAAPGVVVGEVIFDPDEVASKAKQGKKVILVRPETSPDDIHGVRAAEGVLSSRGGLTSHAAIVTRAMGKPCVCGAEEIVIDLQKERFEVDNQVISKGDIITIDGNTGKVYSGALPLIESEEPPEVGQLMTWADEFRRLRVRANAASVHTIRLAMEFGADGIGLCRTERQFSAPDRLAAIRQLILAKTKTQRAKAITQLRELQKEDFVAIFKELGGLPIIIRLLDPPLHEFLPHESEVADPETRERIIELKEVNPMLGHRGVRVGITYPEIYQMQIDAIIEAKSIVPANVSIMLPQVIAVEELVRIKGYTKEKIDFGIMVETVRSCVCAAELAVEAAFFSFGTNDLTQAACSLSREDAERKFLPAYIEMGILKANPFEVLDFGGVGKLMEFAVTKAREVNRDIEIGICGEHGGEPQSIKFCHRLGLDYVSCSPFRILAARLAAAQAALES